MGSLRYWDTSAGKYVPLLAVGRKGPTGPVGPAGPQGAAALPEVAVGTQDPQPNHDLWVLPDGGGAALMTRSGDTWVPRHDLGGAKGTSVGTPTAGSDIATKGYVDSTAPIGNTGWVNIPYENGWKTYVGGPARCPARCRMTRDGVVVVSGEVAGGTLQQPLGVLPVGCRPQYPLIVVIYQDVQTSGFSRLTVQPNGNLIIEFGSTAYQCIDCMFIP